MPLFGCEKLDINDSPSFIVREENRSLKKSHANQTRSHDYGDTGNNRLFYLYLQFLRSNRFLANKTITKLTDQPTLFGYDKLQIAGIIIF